MKIIQPSAILFLVIINLTSCISSKNLDISSQNHHNPKASAYNVQLGLAYLQQGNQQRAKQKLLTAIEEAPESASANDALAYYFENVQNITEAENYYQRAIQLSHQSGAALNNYGAFLCRQKQYKRANEYFLNAIRDSSYLNTGLAYENAGLCAVAQKNTIKAKHYFQMALAQDPHLEQSLYELAQIASQNHSP